MSDCTKKPYPTRWHAEQALIAMRQRSGAPTSRQPVGLYPCAACPGMWHLTSKRNDFTTRWLRALC